MSLVLETLTTMALSFGEITSWFNILGKKINYKNVYIYISIVFLTLFQILNFHYIYGFIKSVGVLVILIIVCALLTKEKLKQCIILSFFTEVLIIISESLIALIISIFTDVDFTSQHIIITYCADIIVSLLLYFLSKLKFVYKLYEYIVRNTSQIKLYQVLLFSLFLMVSCSSAFSYVYLRNNVTLIIFVNVIISIVYTVIVILIFNYQNRYIKISAKYNNSIDNLSLQEIIINDYRTMNHENKNQLLTIKSMIEDKKVISYISTLINQKESFNNEILDETLRLPKGGIRGLIYCKIIYMKDNNINYNLNVDKNITSKLLNKLSDKDMVDICQILGVLLDNAIESAVCSKTKTINIGLHYQDSIFEIIIVNSYDNKLNIGRDNVLKTTKGKGHGYGLQLVRRIIAKNDKLSNSCEIAKKSFTQKILVNL